MKNIFKFLCGALFAIIGFSTFALTTVATPVYAETEQVQSETVYEIIACAPQASSYSITAKETDTIAYNVTYSEILPDDFDDPAKYQDSKLQITDFSIQTTDDNGDGVCTVNSISVSHTAGTKICVYKITLTAGSKAGSVAVICTNGSNIVKIKIDKAKTFFDSILNLLSQSAVLTLIVTLAVTVIGKSAIKIFRFGVNYKSEFATKEEEEKFQLSIREEIRNTKVEMQDSILKICLREINRETRPLRDLQSMATSIMTDREILTVRLDSIDQKYNEIRKLSDNINQLEQKVNRLQYSDGTSDIRRSGK